nr:immunoglobulin light chain junction region [Macaca mulatta]MOX52939.1 immunoglobulin light chain junction region [Macaca mulatta]MOX53683.1 immunoglobulin light chain junction region [Macaca mulatta]MOX55246.1 immunoglobulin light chain junction region [Macaca mulatta]MOX55611.1 immunoglobulin light chain junction region [Macaca mulatta]
CQQGNSIPYSF